MGIHISGLTSGNDYTSMVDQLVAAKRIPIEALETEQSELDYDLGAWSEVQSLATTLTDSLDELRGYALWNSTSAESSFESVLTATASAGSVNQSYSISVSRMAAAQSISSDQIDTSTDLISGGFVEAGNVFTIEDQEITIEAGETLSSLRLKINSAALSMPEESRVQASIVNEHLVLTRTETGDESIALSDVSGTALQGLGILDSSSDIKNIRVTGENAEFTVNGIPVERASNTQLTDVIEGVTLKLQGTGSSTLEISSDTDAAKEALLTFVDAYNALATKVDEYGTVSVGSSSDLSVTGELYGDSLITSMRTNLRRMATASKSPVLNETNASYSYDGKVGVMDSLSDLGIWTYGETNQLSVIDEDRLDDMLENEFENMEQLFKGIYNDDEIAYQDGIASDFYKYISQMSEPLTGGIDERIQSMTDQYDDMTTEIEELEDALTDYEQDQWDIFTAMEDALANLEYQKDYIESMFSSS